MKSLNDVLGYNKVTASPKRYSIYRNNIDYKNTSIYMENVRLKDTINEIVSLSRGEDFKEKMKYKFDEVKENAKKKFNDVKKEVTDTATYWGDKAADNAYPAGRKIHEIVMKFINWIKNLFGISTEKRIDSVTNRLRDIKKKMNIFYSFKMGTHSGEYVYLPKMLFSFSKDGLKEPRVELKKTFSNFMIMLGKQYSKFELEIPKSTGWVVNYINQHTNNQFDKITISDLPKEKFQKLLDTIINCLEESLDIVDDIKKFLEDLEKISSRSKGDTLRNVSSAIGDVQKLLTTYKRSQMFLLTDSYKLIKLFYNDPKWKRLVHEGTRKFEMDKIKQSRGK